MAVRSCFYILIFEISDMLQFRVLRLNSQVLSMTERRLQNIRTVNQYKGGPL